MTLNDLLIGQTAVIAGHSLPRLVSMGIQSGMSIKVIRCSPGNTVLHCRIGSVEFAIRRSIAEQILVQVGISLVSIEQARLNLNTELNNYNWDFDQVVKDGQNEWNDLMSTIQVETKSEELKTKFYTNMYRAYVGRTIWSDVNGKYMDMYEKEQTISVFLKDNPPRPLQSACLLRELYGRSRSSICRPPSAFLPGR